MQNLKKKKKNILVVFGTRPEAIKMAPLCIKLRKERNFFNIKICTTGQHKEMLRQVMNIFSIKEDFNLNVMKRNQTLNNLTVSILSSFENIISNKKYDLVLVHGDTTTSFAVSLACFYHKIKVGHVEAGLRTNDIYSPFPEEMNRQFNSMIAEYHFTPTLLNKSNLIKQGIKAKKIILTGNTAIDALLMTLDKIESNPEKKKKIINSLDKKLQFPWMSEKFILVTGHRRENFGSGFKNICDSIVKLSKKFKSIHFIYPVHLNPNVKKPAEKLLKNISNVHLIKPLDYESFIILMKNCYFVLTDSGGIQEEAPSLGKPVMVMREKTERLEGVSFGNVKLLGSDKIKIIRELSILIKDQKEIDRIKMLKNPYGDGHASKKIIEFLKKKL